MGDSAYVLAQKFRISVDTPRPVSRETAIRLVERAIAGSGVRLVETHNGWLLEAETAEQAGGSPSDSVQPPHPSKSATSVVSVKVLNGIRASIRRIGTHEFEISSPGWDHLRNSLLKLFTTEARMVPAANNSGIKLFAIRPGTALSALGLQNGDTVRSINGAALDTIQKVFDMSAGLQGAREIRLEIDRLGRVPVELRWKRASSR